MPDADFLIEKAEQCFRLARDVERVVTSAGDLSKELSTLGHELMAKAVALDTARDKANKSQ